MVNKSTLRLVIPCLVLVALCLPLSSSPAYSSKQVALPASIAPPPQYLSPASSAFTRSPSTPCHNLNGDDCAPWWGNNPCDSINYKNRTGTDSYILSDSTGKKAVFRGIEACGPLSRLIGSAHNFSVSFYPGGPPEQEWTSTELVKRYLYRVFGIPDFGNTNGSQVVTTYSKAYPNFFHVIANGTPGVFPQPGDVLSYGNPTTTAGHSSIVTSLTITDKIHGNGSITVIDQNGFVSGQGTHTITRWVVDGTNEGGYQITAWLTPKSATWNVMHSPNPGTYVNGLLAVAAISTTDVWAVGDYDNANGIKRTLTEHWNGTRWSLVPSANVGSLDNELYGVTAVSASDVWAVGAYYDSFGVYETLTEHWNGSKWSVVLSPSPGAGNFLQAVTTVSANDVWAVGYAYQQYGGSLTLTEHWNGTSWKVVSSPNPGQSGKGQSGGGGGFDTNLSGVVALSPSNVWAVGTYFNYYYGISQTLIEHWNGKYWLIVYSPSQPSGSNLSGVAAISSKNLWAVGFSSFCPYYYCGSDTLIERWDGIRWSTVPTGPGPGQFSNTLSGVAAISQSDIWAVGSYSNCDGYYCPNVPQTLIEQWNGKIWSVVPSPSPSSQSNVLLGVATVSTNDIWAVGSVVGSTARNSGAQETLIEHYR